MVGLVNIGIVVEGHCEKIFVESDLFKRLCQNQNIHIIQTLNATGNGNLCSHNIQLYISELRQNPKIDQILVLADLDPETCAPCITQRKERMGQNHNGADYIVIARNAIESWFLADLPFLQQFFKKDIPIEIPQNCEQERDPFQKIKSLNLSYNSRGLRNKKQFIKRNCNVLNLNNSAKHSPSAAYLLTTLQNIADQTS